MLNVQYFIENANNSLPKEVYARATLQVDFSMGMNIGYNTSLQLTPDTSENYIAEEILTWATYAAMYHEGDVTVETNILPTKNIHLAHAPNLNIIWKKAIHEALSPMRSGIALLG